MCNVINFVVPCVGKLYDFSAGSKNGLLGRGLDWSLRVELFSSSVNKVGHCLFCILRLPGNFMRYEFVHK